jgi:hypothetical protein
MRKELVIVTSALFLCSVPAFASQGKSQEAQDNHGMEVKAEKRVQTVLGVEDDVQITPTVTLTLTPTPTTEEKDEDDRGVPSVKGVRTSTTECNPDGNWENHGAYVSCVAKLHQGGKTVSEAARSDIGKKKHGDGPTVTPSPSATPTATLTPTPPISSPEDKLTVAFAPFERLKNALLHLLSSLPFFTHHA